MVSEDPADNQVFKHMNLWGYSQNGGWEQEGKLEGDKKRCREEEKGMERGARWKKQR